MKIIFLLLFVSAAYNHVLSQTDTLITISEVMFYAPSGNNEFIELFNRSSSRYVDLKNWKIRYYTSSPDSVAAAKGSTILAPLSYAVIMEGDYDFSGGVYSSVIPQAALLLKITNNSFGTSGMSNTQARTIRLISARGDTVESYTYSIDNLKAFSDEKINPDKDNNKDNWKNSRIIYGSPGGKNTVFPAELNLSLSNIKITPLHPLEGDNIKFLITIKNTGTSSSQNYTAEIYNDINMDSAASNNELIESRNGGSPASGDSVTIEISAGQFNAGRCRVICRIISQGDEISEDNIRMIDFSVLTPLHNYNDVVISEIMYAPAAPCPEWIEIYNRTDKALNLRKFYLRDRSSSAILAKSNYKIDSHSYLVISRDSIIQKCYPYSFRFLSAAIPSLNNTGDVIALYDSMGIKLDSIEYFPEWGGSSGGRSLERINLNDPHTGNTNWKQSVSPYHATPGLLNSVTPKDYDLSVASFITDEKYGIIGTPIHFQITVKNIGVKAAGSFAALLFYDKDNDLIYEKEEEIFRRNYNPILPADSLVIKTAYVDFSKGVNNFLAGIEYIQDNDTSNNFMEFSIRGVQKAIERGDIVINEIMYAPDSGEAEWIELYNRSSKSIELNNFRISDNKDTIISFQSRSFLSIPPGEYFVISKDESILSLYTPPKHYCTGLFPILNNEGDKIILLDTLGRVIDSLQYYSSWGGKGRSLEKLDADLSPLNQSSWKECIKRGTPGEKNSAVLKKCDIVVKEIIIDPLLPQLNNDVAISAKVLNAGKLESSFLLKLFELGQYGKDTTKLLETSALLNLHAGDSVTYRFNYLFKNISSQKHIMVTAFLQEDEDTANNSLELRFSPGYGERPVLINEIMYMPEGGEPEWIELYNNSNTDINLNNWTISDILSQPVKVKIRNEPVIKPGKFLVISRDSSIFHYYRSIPSEVFILSLPVFNNDEDGVVLKDNRLVIVDSVRYGPQYNGKAGRSLERKYYGGLSTDKNNWSASSDIEQATPGRINSAAPAEYDIEVKELSFSPSAPVKGDSISLSVKIINRGMSAVNSFTAECSFRKDSLSGSIVLCRFNLGRLEASDSMLFNTPHSVLKLDSRLLVSVKIILSSDEHPENNCLERVILPGEKRKSIQVSEIMFDPVGKEPEWVELYNSSSEIISMEKWSISDIYPYPVRAYLKGKESFILPGEYIVVAKDSILRSYYPGINFKLLTTSFGTLGNDYDGIILCDVNGSVIDSVKYSAISEKGRSVEKMFSRDELWLPSVSDKKATPGEINSAESLKEFTSGVVINEIMFEPSQTNSEFLEIFNPGSDSIDLALWTIKVNDNKYHISPGHCYLPPGEYFLAAADSSVLDNYSWLKDSKYIKILNSGSLRLSNSGGVILLKDAFDNTIDSVSYKPEFYGRRMVSGQNRSVERINPFIPSCEVSNWSASASPGGATPGRINSIYSPGGTAEKKLNISPNPFSPDNDGYEDFSVITYNLKKRAEKARIRIYDSHGRLVRTLTENLFNSDKGSMVFDGLNDAGAPLKIGIYILYLETSGSAAGARETMKAVVVIARKL